MLDTPEKNLSESIIFSPVRSTSKFSIAHRLHLFISLIHFTTILGTSAQTKTPRNDPTGVRDKIKSIAKIIIENHRKWGKAHEQGNVLVARIAKLKSNAIRSCADSGDSASQETVYPPEMKVHCDRLRMITTIFEDIRDAAYQLQRELTSLINLGAENVIKENALVFKTWSDSHLQTLVGDLCAMYGREYELKRTVMENVAHSRRTDEITIHSCVWEFQIFVTAELGFKIRQLTFEADIELDSSKSSEMKS